MNIQEIETFFNYQPYTQDPKYLVEEIKKIASTYMEADALDLIDKAYEFAKQAHSGHTRLSGETYIIHPLKATIFLMRIKPDITSIQACILHDVIEDTPVTYNDIVQAFNQEVADLCEGLVKVSKIRYQGEDRHLETLKKTFLAMARDLRVIFIKLADRLHNIQTLSFHPQREKQEKIAQETMKIYVPIAKKLGLYQFQLYLENGCFKILHPQEFERIVQFMRTHFSDEYRYVEQGIEQISTLLKKENISDFTVKGRLKSPYRIREKMYYKYNTNDFAKVMDMLAFRVITKTISDVYLTLGIIHNHYTPIINKIKDYIAIPKFNGYQSIHTTILGMFPFPVEIQIRTQEMEEIAEYGVAAHYGYSEHRGSVRIPQKQADWIKKLKDLVDTYQNSDNKEGFKNQLNIEVLNKATFLYTPKGDIVELPQGATVLDFAFHIHTEVGLKFKHALVNWEIKPIGYVPHSGDVVMIQTWKNKYSASAHRLDYLKTPSARSHLQRYLKQKNKELILKNTIAELNTKLKALSLPLFRSKDDAIAKSFSAEEIEKKLLEIADKKYSYMKLIHDAYPELKHNYKHTHVVEDIEKKTIKDHVIIDGNSIINYHICPECRPKVGQKIIAKASRHDIKIHSLSCKALKTVSYSHLFEAHWQGQDANVYQFTVVVQFPQHTSNMMHIIQRLSEFTLHLQHIGVKNLQNGIIEMTIQAEYKSPAQIDYLLKDLKNYHASLQIKSRILS